MFVKSTRIRYRYSLILLKQLVISDFKLRYQGSVLGYAWSLLRPLLLFVILYFVFVQGLRVGDDVPHFPIYLLLGIVLWSFFAEMTNISLSSIVARGDLIRKIRIPRWIIIVSASVTALINLTLNLVVVGVFLAFSHISIQASTALLLPILLQLYVFALGMSLFLSAAFVKYRDVSYIWEVFLQAGFYITPVIYPLSKIKNVFYQKLLLLSPVATAVQDARHSVVTTKALTISSVYGSSTYRLIPYAVSLGALIIGVLYFRKEAKTFAENL